jgi:Kef-type K+ transport system membrane component KefB
MVAAMNFDNIVVVLAVAAAVPLILAAVPRVPVPGPVLEIVAGIVLGPAVLSSSSERSASSAQCGSRG